MKPRFMCERPGCFLDAVYYRWRTDPTTRGANLNEPGMRQEFLCIAHANDVREYVGDRLERIEDENKQDENTEGKS